MNIEAKDFSQNDINSLVMNGMLLKAFFSDHW
jgi:hypothetical protein